MSQTLELSNVIHDPSTPDAQAHPSKHLENSDHPPPSSTWAPITDESAESRPPPLAPSGTSDNNTNTSSSKPSPPRPSLRSARANSSVILRSPVLGPRSASAHPPRINNDLDEIRQSRVGPARTNGRTHRRVASDQSSSYPHYDSSARRPYSDTASRPQTPSQGSGLPHSHSHHHPHHHPVRSHSFHHHDRHTIVPFRHPSTPLASGGGGGGIGGSTSAAAPAGAVASPTYSTYSNYSLFNTQPSSRSPSGSGPRSASPATSVSSDQSSSVMHTAPNSAVLLPDRIDSPSSRLPPHRYEVSGGSGVSTLQFPTAAAGSASSYGRSGSPYDNGAVTGSVNGSGAGRQKNRKQRLTNAHRKQICIFHNENPTMRQEDIAAHFNVERSTISKILKSAEKWLSVPEGDDDKVAKHRPSKFPVIETRLVKWLESMYERGAMPTLSDALIRNNARNEAKAVSCSEDKFKASSGWVENFKHRHCIRKGVWHRDEYYATTALSLASHQLPPPALSKLNPAYDPSVRPPYVGSPLAMSAVSTTMMSHVPPSPSPMSSVAGPSRQHFMAARVVQSPDEEEGMGMNVDHEMVDGTTGPYSRYPAAATGGAEPGSAMLPRMSSVPPHSPSRILAPLSLMQQQQHHHHHHQQQQPYGSYDPHEHHHHHHHHHHQQGHSTSYDYQQHKLPPLNATVAEQGDPSPSSSSSSSSAAAASATRPLKLLDRPDGGEMSTTVLPPMYDRPDDQGAHAYRSHHHPAAGSSSSSSTASSSGVPRYEQQQHQQQQQEHSPNEEHRLDSAYPHEQEQQEQEPFSTTTEDFSARARREFPPPPINDARPHIPEVEYAINTVLEFLDREGKELRDLDQKDVAALYRIKKVLFQYAGGI